MSEPRFARVFKDLRSGARSALGRLGRAAARRERLLAGLALAAIAVVLAGFAAVHVIVSSRLLRNWVNTSPDELLLGYESASSWVPGVIRARGLEMRGSDRNVQWFFRMEEATISVSLLDLLRKEFHATRVRASGLVFLLREKGEKSDLSTAHLARIPKIPGFSDPPLKIEAPRPELPSPEEKQRFWSVRIEDLIADPAPDIWVELYRFRGRARVTGGFFLHPHVEARVGPAAVRFVAGDVTLGPQESMLASVSGRAGCVIDPFDPDATEGEAVWRKISGSIAIQGRLSDLGFLNHFLRALPQPRLAGGGGTARVSVRFNHGIGGGDAHFGVHSVTARYKEGTLQGKASGRLEIPRWDVERNNMEISGSRVDLTDVVTIGTPRDERDWWGRFDIVAGRLRDGLVAQTSVACRDARPLYTLLRAKLPRWAQGILKLEGLNATARVRLAHDLVDVEDLEASGGRFRIAGQYREKGEEVRGAFLIETGPLAIGVAIDDHSSHVKLFGARTWFRDATASVSASNRATGRAPKVPASPGAP